MAARRSTSRSASPTRYHPPTWATPALAPPLNRAPGCASQVLDMRRKSLVCSGPLGLTPKSILTWAGFSDSGVLFVMDSEGMLFALLKVHTPYLLTLPR